MARDRHTLMRDQGLLTRVPAPRIPPEKTRAARFVSWFLTSKRSEPRPSYIGLLEAPDDDKLGVCCSGGGIRSAAFNLGALQSLQARGALQKADYLAAVSGGSYIAAAHAMVAKTGGNDDSDATVVDDDHPPFHSGSPEEQYVRNRSSYLAPDGLGKLFLGYRVLLGLLFNLFFLGLPLFVAGVVLALVLYAPLYGALSDPVGNCVERQADACDFAADVPDLFWYVLGGLGLAIVANGLGLLLLRPRRDFWRRGFEAWATRLVLALAALAVMLVAIPLLAEVLLNYGDESGGSQAGETASAPGVPAVGAASLTTVLLAVLLQLRARAAEPATVLQAAKGVRDFFRRLGPRMRLILIYAAGAVAGPLLLLLIVIVGASLTLADEGSSANMLLLAAGAALLFLGLYFFADLNVWSLHPFYRRRLCSAFALKRVEGDDGLPVAVERDYGLPYTLSDAGVPGLPTLLVCAAANVSDPGATPPGRGVTSFTFTETAIGGPLLGAARTVDYEDALGRNRERDVTLPAAIAMSGAALAPSMGKLTVRPFTFLMALANVRLGVWVPNPRHVADWKQRGFGRSENRHDLLKRPRPNYLIRELLGRNRLDAKFVYVSDGGHYENLGLVELLRRGCTRIYCFDASGGRTFVSLGDAIALARSELQVEIDIDTTELVPHPETNVANRDCIAGTIRYPDGSTGVLVYARTVMTHKVPFDVRAYREDDPVFPNHSTVDQLYTDQKFEAYRALGRKAGENALDEMAISTALVEPL
jgi:Patatin-like phospholipase